MTLEQYYLIAQIVASIAVIGSLLFLGFEVRQNWRQTRLANWESSIDRFNRLWSRTNDPLVADIVTRGRKDSPASPRLSTLPFTIAMKS